MIQFGSVTADNFQGLQNIATIVQHSIGVSTVNFLNFRTSESFAALNQPKIQTKRPKLKVFCQKTQMKWQTVKILIRLLL